MTTLARAWSTWIIRGVVSILFGILTIFRPGASVALVVLLYGIFALCDGAVMLSFALRTDGRRAPYVWRGLISLAAGLIAVFLPGLTAVMLYLLIGAWAIGAGIMELVIASQVRKDGLSIGGLVFAGLLGIACGIALLALPIAGVFALLGVIAGFAIVNGIALIAAGVRIHSLTQAFVGH
jgi:uncharacterized membrane protein HdeD (DUF308 family)